MPEAATKAAEILEAAWADPARTAWSGSTRAGWQRRFVNRLVREAGCDQAVAGRHMDELRFGSGGSG